MVAVRFIDAHKEFDDGYVGVDRLNLDIEDGEFLVLLGPSGCGKSTTLRLLAGLEDISGGEIQIDSVRVNDLPAAARGLGMVFQSYALYPHMTIRENLSFGLRMAPKSERLDTAEIDSRVAEVSELLTMEKELDKKPRELSGGQRQRVAIGRALVRRPKVLLMGEPLSNLDAKLRNHMRRELKRLHERHGTTTVYVTHDQVEAMTRADRVAIMADGKL
ncbi:MAG: ABC transporter ATP-binding protein, partial [Pseudomonadota bacterium]